MAAKLKGNLTMTQEASSRVERQNPLRNSSQSVKKDQKERGALLVIKKASRKNGVCNQGVCVYLYDGGYVPNHERDSNGRLTTSGGGSHACAPFLRRAEDILRSEGKSLHANDSCHGECDISPHANWSGYMKISEDVSGDINHMFDNFMKTANFKAITETDHNNPQYLERIEEVLNIWGVGKMKFVVEGRLIK